MTSIDPQLAAALVEQAPDAVIFADLEGIVRAWNPAAAAMFGYSAEDAIGQSLDIIVPEQFREAHWKGYARATEAGVTKYIGESLPTRAVKASGETFYVELSFAIVLDAAGKAIGALAHARDINERFQTDRANRRRLRELEEQVKAAAQD
jgi:PAS domain S-box-containing protein